MICSEHIVSLGICAIVGIYPREQAILAKGQLLLLHLASTGRL
jgi:hypothetical protein